MKKNKRERDEDSMRHGDQYDTQLLWFLMRHMRNSRPQRVRAPTGSGKSLLKVLFVFLFCFCFVFSIYRQTNVHADTHRGRRARYGRVLELFGLL